MLQLMTPLVEPIAVQLKYVFVTIWREKKNSVYCVVVLRH